MTKRKLLILQGSIPVYREKLFNLLGERYDLTIGYIQTSSVKTNSFKSEKVTFKKLGGVYLPTFSFLKLLLKFDVIIIMPDLHCINYCLIPFLPLKAKVLSFSIGFRASYRLLYNTKRRKTFKDYIFLFILKKCDANIFYYSEPLKFWGKLLNKGNTFIANNTLPVLEVEHQKDQKKSILFIGSLIEGKGIFDLLDAFNNAYKTSSIFKLKLNIVGDGPLRNKVQHFISENRLDKIIQLKGSIYDEQILRDYFKEAIFCVSPNQAGLSVLKSFGYGVPFVTRIDSITGGEKYNILNGVNGILYETKNELYDLISNAFSKLDGYYQMGIEAKEYYDKNLTVESMKDNFIEAIEFNFK